MLPSIRSWDAAKSLAEMDRAGVSTALLSVSTQAFTEAMDVESRRQLARTCNDFGRQLVTKHAGRFGLFAFLPLPDVEGSLHELEYSIDTLGVDGVGLMTSYDSRWIGDPSFSPLLEELDRRHAVAFVHPRAPACCANLMPQTSRAEAGLLEFPYDTGRAIVSLLLGGSLIRYRNIKWIFCHAGGAIPMLAGRIRTSAPDLVPNLEQIAPEGIDFELRRLYFDTANSAYPATMAALLTYSPIAQVFFGSDYPYVGIDRNMQDFSSLQLRPEQADAIQRGNALRLFPRLASVKAR